MNPGINRHKYPNKAKVEAVLASIDPEGTDWTTIRHRVEKQDGIVTNLQIRNALRILEYRGEIVRRGASEWATC